MNKKIWKVWNRVLSFSLAMVLLTGTVIGDAQIVRAVEPDIMPAAEIPLELADQYIKLLVSDGVKVNQADVELDSTQRFGQENVVHIPYGNPLSFTTDMHSTYPGMASFHVYYAEQSAYEAHPDDSLVEWTSDTVLDPGNYYFHLELVVDEAHSIVTSQSGRYFGIVIDEAQLKAPTVSIENGSTAKISYDGTTVDGVNVAEKVRGSQISVYREVAGGEDVLVYSTELAKGATEIELKDELLKAGPGSYYMVSSVLAVEGCAQVADSEISAKETAPRTKVVSVTTQKDGGIQAVTPAETEENLLIAGNSSTKLDLTATTVAGHGFKAWIVLDGDVASEDDSVVFDPSKTNSSTSVSLGQSYESGLDLVLYAATLDESAPTIVSYEAGTKDGQKALTATVRDEESGVSAYAFTTKSEKLAKDDAAFINLEDTVVGQDVSVSFIPTESGTYYFNVRDKEGNVTQSDKSIQVTKLTCHNVMVDGALGSSSEMIYGVSDYALTEPVRREYTFQGYFYGTVSANAIEANRVEKLTIPSAKIAAVENAGGIDVYASWQRDKVEFESQPQDVEKIYDGKAETLTGKLKNASDATYQWYRKIGAQPYQPVEGADQASLTVKDVKDSGTYYLEASITVDGVEEKATTDAIDVTI